jgi:hypothetical protein
MGSPDQTATLTLDNTPLLMSVLRSKFRENLRCELSIAQFRTLTFVNTNPGISLSTAAYQIGLGLPSMSKFVDM